MSRSFSRTCPSASMTGQLTISASLSSAILLSETMHVEEVGRLRSLFVELLNEARFIKLLDEAPIGKLLRLMIPDFRTRRGHIFEAGFHSRCIGVGGREKNLGEKIVRFIHQFFVVHA